MVWMMILKMLVLFLEKLGLVNCSRLLVKIRWLVEEMGRNLVRFLMMFMMSVLSVRRVFIWVLWVVVDVGLMGNE